MQHQEEEKAGENDPQKMQIAYYKTIRGVPERIDGPIQKIIGNKDIALHEQIKQCLEVVRSAQHNDNEILENCFSDPRYAVVYHAEQVMNACETSLQKAINDELRKKAGALKELQRIGTSVNFNIVNFQKLVGMKIENPSGSHPDAISTQDQQTADIISKHTKLGLLCGKLRHVFKIQGILSLMKGGEIPYSLRDDSNIPAEMKLADEQIKLANAKINLADLQLELIKKNNQPKKNSALLLDIKYLEEKINLDQKRIELGEINLALLTTNANAEQLEAFRTKMKEIEKQIALAEQEVALADAEKNINNEKGQYQDSGEIHLKNLKSTKDKLALEIEKLKRDRKPAEEKTPSALPDKEKIIEMRNLAKIDKQLAQQNMMAEAARFCVDYVDSCEKEMAQRTGTFSSIFQKEKPAAQAAYIEQIKPLLLLACPPAARPRSPGITERQN